MALQDELATPQGDVDLDRDRLLVERSQSGDGSAFAELYTCYYDRLHRFCVRRLHDDAEAHDVAQEAFAKAWRALPSFAGERRFYPWLTVIAGNLCTDVLRRRSRSNLTGDFDAVEKLETRPSLDDSIEDRVVASVETGLAREALSRLSERHRRVLVLREGSGWSYQRIASHEGVEISAIETLLWRARQALKREYAAVSGGALAALIGIPALAGRGLGRAVRRVAEALGSRLPLAEQGAPLFRGLRGALLAVAAAATVTGSTLAALSSGSAPAAPSGVSTPAVVAPAAPAAQPAAANVPDLTAPPAAAPPAGTGAPAAPVPPAGAPAQPTTASSAPSDSNPLPSVPSLGPTVGGALSAAPDLAGSAAPLSSAVQAAGQLPATVGALVPPLQSVVPSASPLSVPSAPATNPLPSGAAVGLGPAPLQLGTGGG